MRKISQGRFSVLVSLGCILLVIPLLSANVRSPESFSPVGMDKITPDSAINPVINKFTIYNALNLEEFGLSKNAFQYAINGYQQLLQQGKIKNADVLTIIDFSKPSTEKRLFVFDVQNMQLLYQTFVSHGMNSGTLYAKRFSNRPGSNMSSLGFYITGNTYMGQHGYSLRLDGQEKGINNNANKRAIVIHSADYASAGFISSQGYLGRSYGCPAIPQREAKPIIETIKEGSCLFIYAPSKTYEMRSNLL